MASVVYSARSLAQLERTIEVLRREGAGAELTTADAVCSAVDMLAAHPLLGRRVHGEIRELVISYGPTGHIALYRFLVRRDEVRILAIGHQREIGYVP